MSDIIDTGSKRRRPSAKRSRAEAIGERRKIDRSENELELGRFVGKAEPSPKKTATQRSPDAGEVVGPRRGSRSKTDTKAKRAKGVGEMQIAAPLALDDQPSPRRPRARRRTNRADTNGIRSWGRIGVLALLSGLLLAMTAVTFLLLPRYQTLGEPLIADPAFEAGLDGWQQAGSVTFSSNGPAEIVLENSDPKVRTHLLQDIELPPGDTLLVLHAAVQGDDVVTGPDAWDSARVYLAQLDGDGQPIWTEDHNLFNLYGTTDVRNYVRAFSIPADIAVARLGIEMKNATGRLAVGKLELAVVERRMPYVIAKGCVMFAWAALVIYAAIKTFGGIASARIKLWLGIGCALAVIALMLPGGVHDTSTKDIAAHFGTDGAGIDAIGHGIMFATLAFLVRLGRPFDPVWLHAVAWLVIAVGSEVLQLLTFNRNPSLDDLWVDGIGILIGLALAEIARRMRRSPVA